MLLAQYTIRSKQEYIFKTNRVLEIVGASECIASIWEKLFQCAEEASLEYLKSDQTFEMDSIKRRFAAKTLNMVELFEGGGNETILFDSKESYKSLNNVFSYMILSKFPGMIPMAVCVEARGNYSEDYAALMKASERKKDVMVPEYSFFTVPFAMMDRSTFQPYSHVRRVGNNQVRMSDESLSKYQMGIELRNSNHDVRLFDEMITNKGKESLLAVVHADGNNMGAKIMDLLHGETSYDKAVREMRRFTSITADCFEKKGEEALEACRNKLRKDYSDQISKGKLKENSISYRQIIGSGDDVTFICNARFVMDYVGAYLDSVQNYQKKTGCPWSYSSCAGICIFHSHYPFAKAYSIAEQACDDGAKQKVHAVDEKGRSVPVEQGWVDFHFIHSGISGNLEEIRSRQGTKRCLARPWLISYNEGDKKAESEEFRFSKLKQLKEIMADMHVSRTNIKTIGAAYERSTSAAKKELIHLYGHTEGLQKRLERLFSNEEMRLRALYDFAEIYDLWVEEAL